MKAGLPPSDVRADGQRDLHKSWVGLGFWTALAWAGQGLLPWLCSLHPSPQTPPLCIILHLISGHSCLRASGNLAQDDAGGGRVWVPPFRWLGRGGFWPPLPRERREEVVKTVISLKRVPNFNWWWGCDVMQTPKHPPEQKTWPGQNANHVLGFVFEKSIFEKRVLKKTSWSKNCQSEIAKCSTEKAGPEN